MSIWLFFKFAALWSFLISAGFSLGLAEGSFGAKMFFAVMLVFAIIAMRPNSTEAWMSGPNR